MTTTSTGPRAPSSFNPSCSCSATERLGAFGSTAGGGRPGDSNLSMVLEPADSGANLSEKSYKPANPVLSITGRPTRSDSARSISAMVRPLPPRTPAGLRTKPHGSGSFGPGNGGRGGGGPAGAPAADRKST